MKIAIVTGASSGLGAEFVRTLAAKYGHRLDEIWAIARRKDRLGSLKSEITACTVRPMAMDLSSPDSFSQLSLLLKNAHADLRILVNNAGYCSCGRFDTMEPDRMLSMIRLNVTALTMVSRCCLPHMRKGSFMILTCSVSSFVPVIGQAVYSATKAYVRFLGQALHAEMKQKGVNVLTLCPGNMNTEMNRKGAADEKAGRLPYLNLKTITAKSLERAAAGKGFYTPGWFYKGYRVVSKLLPQALLLMKATDGMF